MVTYALISTSPQASTDQADQLTEMLTNLVNYSHTGGAGSSEPLPPGYVPLPDNLAQQALTEISKDVIAPNGQPVGGEAAAAASLAAKSASQLGSRGLLPTRRAVVRFRSPVPWERHSE